MDSRETERPPPSRVSCGSAARHQKDGEQCQPDHHRWAGDRVPCSICKPIGREPAALETKAFAPSKSGPFSEQRVIQEPRPLAYTVI
jgi:hypothetical protein